MRKTARTGLKDLELSPPTLIILNLQIVICFLCILVHLILTITQEDFDISTLFVMNLGPGNGNPKIYAQ